MNSENNKQENSSRRSSLCGNIAWTLVRLVPLLILCFHLLSDLLPDDAYNQNWFGNFGLSYKATPDSDNEAIPFKAQKEREAITNNSVERLKSDRKKLLSTFAVALKTGGEVMSVRLPIIQHTWLRHFENVLVIGDHNEKMGGLVVHDVITGQSGVHVPKMSLNKAKIIEDTDGWKNDAFKNLPDADWYLMVDDDTYVYVDNLVHFMANKDPLKPQYIGAGTKFIGCDNVTEYGQGPRFAHGGAGILLSGAIMKNIFSNATNIDVCAKKYQRCMFGDVRVSLCLRDHDIYLTPYDSFNFRLPNNLVGGPRWPAVNPCTRPVTHHKMTPHQLLAIYQAETQAQRLGQVVDMGYLRTLQLAGDTSDHNDTIWRSADHTLVGQPFHSLRLLRPSDCARVCEVNAVCVGWVLTPDNLCQLHDRPRIVRQAIGFTAGRVFMCRAVLSTQHNISRGYQWVYQLQTGVELVPSLWND